LRLTTPPYIRFEIAINSIFPFDDLMKVASESKYPTLAHPPIVEALVDIRVPVSAGVDITLLKNAHEQVKNDYPVIHEQREWVHRSEHRGEEVTGMEIQFGTHGVQFVSEDGKQIVQFRRDGFTFNRLFPYECWDRVKEEALTLWEIYKAVTNVETVSRLALRYINKISFEQGETPERILNLPFCLPAFPELLIRNFVYQSTVKHAKSNYSAIFTLAREKVIHEGPPLLIFDIDVFSERLCEAETDQLFSTLEELRNFKNDLFFKSITDKGIKKFQ